MDVSDCTEVESSLKRVLGGIAADYHPLGHRQNDGEQALAGVTGQRKSETRIPSDEVE
jgi:hypothetical protein